MQLFLETRCLTYFLYASAPRTAGFADRVFYTTPEVIATPSTDDGHWLAELDKIGTKVTHDK